MVINHSTAATDWCALSADRPCSCQIELGSLREIMTLTRHLTLESSA